MPSSFIAYLLSFVSAVYFPILPDEKIVAEISDFWIADRRIW